MAVNRAFFGLVGITLEGERLEERARELAARTANTRSRRTSAISEAGTIPTAWIMTVERYVPYAFESVPLTVTIAETSMAVANEIK